MSESSKPGASKPVASKAEEKVLNRRKFLGAGAAVGVSAAASIASSQAATSKDIAWDREVDIIVIGAGASGLPAAIAARDGGAEVIVVEHHFDIGGIAIMSGGDRSLPCRSGPFWLLDGGRKGYLSLKAKACSRLCSK